ncbi:AAA family ATPase [Campylobacter lari]|uniref:AAA family ATPase n=3 Tax=Campylobacter lari TaxID=201 RepID=UPI00156F558E|nr:AAA family ATPase [Campylobacter lari]EHJ5165098.1 AAA family ATPase [Campylobacter lari]EHJ5166301.1 AAA family ATPase [Campylobacter lari]MCW0196059.1 AAA family ATPase [Campylobacter lari]MCW0237923.1 AAA family ATPase [Campylobacter lari]MCW0262323.1 AAA family ATPase [Campylobacter lari]
MIKKIKKINYKSFNNYNSSNLDFSRINILYGRNGQGKSSLVNFIKDNIKNNNLDIFETSSNDFSLFFYDSDYKNRLFYSDDKFKTFFMADNIENIILEKSKIFNKIEKLKKFKDKIEEKLNTVYKNKKELKSTIAKNTREVLSEIDSNKYNTPQSYQSTHIDDSCLSSEKISLFEILSYDEFEKIKSKKKNLNYEIIEVFNFDKFKQIENGVKKIDEMLKQTPENNAIDRFKQDNDLENLARLAFDIKNKSEIYKDKCPLCEQNILGIKLWENLEKHFNEEYKQFIERLEKAKNFFENSITELSNYTKWLNGYFVKTKLLIDDDIDKKRQEYLLFIEKSIEEINNIINHIELKKQNPNKNDININCDLNLFQRILSDDIQKSIKQHNKKQQTYFEDIDKNIEEIKKHFIAKEKDNITSYDNLIGFYNKIKEKINCVLEKRNKHIIDINIKLKEMDQSFQKLNKDMEEWSFNDIRFEKIGDTHYKIQRLNFNNEWFDCDKGLSEGEKTIVSIIYFANHFLSQIKEIKECPLVFLDDPINSLDNSNRDKIINYISIKLLQQNRGQFFIATHIDEVCDKFNRKNIEAKSIFEIKKYANRSEIEKLAGFKLNNDFKTTYERLCEYLKSGKYEDAFDISGDVRFILEKICNIFFENTENFTVCYNKLLNKFDITEKYTANDIQDLNHGKNTINSDEIIEKVRFVVEIINKIRDYSCGKL